ncbi:DMT family transporter [bacterium]|nr:DMT family transporter [candidate division CSSED10-310 bacterium]
MARDQRPSYRVLFAALTISVLSISSAATLIRLADAPALVIASFRMLIASAILWAAAPWTKAYRTSGFKWKSIIGAGVFLALHFGFWITSLESTSVASSLVLVTMNPIFVALGSTLLLKDPPSRPLIVGTFVSIVGCFILVVGEGFSLAGSFRGNALALGGACAMSCYMMIGRHAAPHSHFFGYITWLYTLSGLVLVSAALVTGQSFGDVSANSILFMLLIAIIPQVIGHSLINWSLKHLHASYLAAAILVEPLAGTLIAYLVIRESFSRFSLIGGILILSGVAWAFRRRPMTGG